MKAHDNDVIEKRPFLPNWLVILLAWLGVLGLIASVVMWVYFGGLNWWVKGTFIGGLVLLFLYPILRPQFVLNYFRTLGFKRTSQAVLSALLVVGILVLVNIITARHFARLDWTENKIYSLSDQTRNIVKDLKDDVKLIGFFSSDPSDPAYRSGQKFKQLVEQYEALSPHIRGETIDPYKNMKAFLPYKDEVTSLNTVIVQLKDRKEIVYSPDEEDITNALLKLTSNRHPKVYFLTGHGEKSLDDTGEEGLSELKRKLEKEQFEVDKLALMGKKQQIPSDCAVLVVAGPRNELTKDEVAKIESYLDKGGHAFIMVDPAPYASLSGLLEKYNVKVHKDLVFDATCIGDPSIPVIADFNNASRIGKKLGGVVMILARSLEPVANIPPSTNPYGPPPTPVGPTAEWLARTSSMSYSVPYSGQRKVKLDEATSDKGPFNVAVTVTETPPAPEPGPDSKSESPEQALRLVVVGDSDFLTNQVLGARGPISGAAFSNADFALNCIGWLAQAEKLVAIRPKQHTEHTLALTRNERLLVLTVTTVLIPLLMLFFGALIWWRRKWRS